MNASPTWYYCSCESTTTILLLLQDMRGVARLKGQSTATYCAVINGSGELSLGVGDMEIHQQITEKHVRILSHCTFYICCGEYGPDSERSAYL